MTRFILLISVRNSGTQILCSFLRLMTCCKTLPSRRIIGGAEQGRCHRGGDGAGMGEIHAGQRDQEHLVLAQRRRVDVLS
eukprot:397487-Hanusia_phi.AAC.1